MPEIKLGNINAEPPIKQSIEPKAPAATQQKQAPIEWVSQPLPQPTIEVFKRNQLNFVLQQEGLGFDIIGSFLKYHTDSNHQVGSINNCRN